MNCHMPRINEGLQDIVRTHTIFSPTNADMIHANHPNACNQCHTEKSIDWTIGYMQQWYHVKFDDRKLQQHYSSRTQSAAWGWLRSQNEAVRKVAGGRPVPYQIEMGPRHGDPGGADRRP